LMLRALLIALAVMIATNASAADLQVIAGGGIAGPLKELAPEFEKASGHTLTIRFAATPELIKMATSGDSIDVAVVPREVFLDAAAKARFVLEVSVDVARVGFGVAVRAGAPQPDISTPETFKEALLSAGSIATVPTSAAGAQVLKTFDGLGIGDAMKEKIKAQASPGDIPQALIDGKAELAFSSSTCWLFRASTSSGPSRSICSRNSCSGRRWRPARPMLWRPRLSSISCAAPRLSPS